MDYEAFAAAGAMVGHGGVVVFDDTVDMAEQARFAMEFCAEESCGKCTPCRVGSVRGVEVIDRIIAGEDRAANLALLEDLCEVMTDGSLCAMGGLTPMPVRSAVTALPRGLSRQPTDTPERPPRTSARGRKARHDAAQGTRLRHPGQATVRRPSRSRSTGMRVTVPEGTSVMRAAALAGVDIPKLCATDSLEAFGSCRLCLVEVDGRRGTPASCTTPVADGMVVTHPDAEGSPSSAASVMELYISDHPLDCLTCSANGDCELQDMAGSVGLREVRYGYDGENHLDAAEGPHQPVLRLRPVQVHRLLALRAGLRRGPGHVRADDRGPRLRLEGVRRRGRVLPGLRVRVVRRLRAGLPDGDAQEKTVDRARHADPVGADDVRVLRRRLLVQGRAAGDELVRMVPYKDGGANEGHSCVKGRFAFGYATHPDRVLSPMVREKIADAWREVEWDEAIGFVARRMPRDPGASTAPARSAAITSSRCTNEEVYVVQKMVRAAFGNNNVDTCARVCHSPTGYGLKQTFGTSAGTQDFGSVDEADVIVVIGANPTDGHPVFASRMKRRLREGAKLIVVDPRRIDLVRTPHIEAAHHLQLAPGTNVAVINAMAHVVVTEGLVDRGFVAERCEGFEEWAEFIARPENSPEALEAITGVPADELRAAARLYAAGAERRDLLRPRRHRAQPGLDDGDGHGQPRDGTGNIGRDGVGVNPLRGQNNVQGSCDMGSFPHELPGYRHVSDDAVREVFEDLWGTTILAEPGLRIPNMFDAAIDGTFRALFVQGEDIAQSDPNTQHVTAALGALDLVVVQDLFLNETAKFAHVFLPGTSFLEKDGTFTNAERRINRVRPVMPPQDAASRSGRSSARSRTAMGYPMHYDDPRPDHGRDRARPRRRSPACRSTSSTRSAASSGRATTTRPMGTPIMHVDAFARGKGQFVPTPLRADRRAQHPALPADPHHRPDPVASTTSAPRPGVPRTSPGTPRTSSRSTRTTPRCAASPTATGDAGQPRRRDDAARQDLRPDAGGRRLHDVPPPGHRRQRRDHRELRLGDELPGVQGDGRPGRAHAPGFPPAW